MSETQTNDVHQSEEKLTINSFSVTPLLFTTLIISICSMIYELIIGSLSSYLLGNSVVQFSITIGLYLFAMGIGSYFSKFISHQLFDYFVTVELFVGLLGSFSSIFLFLSYIYTDIYSLVMYGLSMGIGFLVGLEIPLLVRIIEAQDKVLKDELANLFAFDYLGGLIGSLAFPLVLLPKFGYITVAFVAGLLNIIAAAIIVYKYQTQIKRGRLFKGLVMGSMLVVVFFMAVGDQLTNYLEGGLYQDQIVYAKQTKYQKIVITKHKEDVRLFLDGNAQFSSKDEQRYHEAMVHIPMAFVNRPKKVLLLGAGDGLAARELLKYPTLQLIRIIDLDQEMVELCRTNPMITKVNQSALDDPRVQLIYQDAFIYLQQHKEKFDVVIVDLPDPNNESLNKLYTTSFYRLVKRNLAPEGVMVTQSSSPLDTGRAFWCINKTVQTEFSYVFPYHLYIPSFGDWGFNLASNQSLDIKNIDLKVATKKLAYLNKQTVSSLFSFSQDERKDSNQLEINTLFKPKLFEYYDGDTNAL